MSTQRPTWWMYLVVASYLSIHLLEAYLVVRGPAYPEGLDAIFENGAMLVRSVGPATPFAQAGLQAGDRVVAVGALSIESPRDWGAALANVQAEETNILQVLRAGRQIELAVTFERATWRNRLDNGVADYLVSALVFFLIGLFIGFSRPRDTTARIGAWLFLTMSTAFGLLNGWAVVWRQSPIAMQLLLWIPEFSRFAIDGIFLSFFAVFPRRLFRTRWLWLVIWIPVLTTLPWRAYGFYSVVYNAGQGAAVPAWLNQAILLRTMVYVMAGLVVLLINYLWLADLNERRRICVLVVGTAIGLSAAAYEAWIYSSQGYGVQSVGFLLRIISVSIVACPLAFAYAILRHRVLDIHVIIRQALQYALARKAVLGVVPALVAVLIVDLAVNSREPLASILRAHGWVYAGVGGLVVAASFRRKQWLEALDRRFFRDRYHALNVLHEIVEEVRKASSLSSVGGRVVARIETALHPEFVSIMIHEQAQREYRPLASVPAGQASPPIAAESKLIALLRVFGKPLEVLLGDSAWLQSRLPEKEIGFVQRERIDLLVPIKTAPGQTGALMALGIKRSEEPYTREDQDLLEAIASSLARLLDQPAPPAETFEECPQCGVCYERGTEKCTTDGATLTAVRLPRTLAGRYRLEQCRGRGGMGSVYAAIDKALDRRVAVKVIREDLVNSGDIAQRFHREAKAAAAFAHPNVVTIHDYGFDGIHAFIVMELLEGVTLRQELNRCKRLDAARTRGIFRGICAAVDAAHRRQLIHRDLKPENIFLVHSSDGAEEVVKVLDFGIAKFLPVYDGEAATKATAETNTGVLVGTLGYVSPEQLMGESPATSWDLWGLAVVAYETITGAMPFPVHSQDWRMAILAGSFTPLTTHLPDSPHRWQTFFADSFATDRKARAKSALEFFHGLEEALT